MSFFPVSVGIRTAKIGIVDAKKTAIYILFFDGVIDVKSHTGQCGVCNKGSS